MHQPGGIDTSRIFRVLGNIDADAWLEGAEGVVRLEVGPKSVVITVHDGAIAAREGRGSADLVATFDEADFVEIALGRRDPLCAAMQGRVKLSGDLGRIGTMGRVLLVLSEHLRKDLRARESRVHP